MQINSNCTHIKLVALVFITFVAVSCAKKETTAQDQSNQINIGIVADCQYCNCEIKWNRYYKKAPTRLRNAVDELNRHDLNFTIHLGDFIDKDIRSFDSINPIWAGLRSESYHVLGNHDFEVADSVKARIPTLLGLEKNYYSIEKNSWKFIILDGNDLSFYAPTDSLRQVETQKLFNSKLEAAQPYAQTYNGGLSSAQLLWLTKELDLAKQHNQNVGFFCHFPAYPIDKHNFWNVDEFLSLIDAYSEVKFFMNGHNHDGSYALRKGVHYITYKGMVDTKDSSSFAMTRLDSTHLYIKGYGREMDRTLKLKP